MAMGIYSMGISLPHRALERAEALSDQQYLAAAAPSVSSCRTSSLAMAEKLLLMR